MEAKTTPVLVSASRRPPSAGPAKLPTLSIELDATFAAVSSSGRVASDGSSAACAGRNAVAISCTLTASPIASSGGPSSSAVAAAPPIASARRRSQVTITRSRR